MRTHQTFVGTSRGEQARSMQKDPSHKRKVESMKGYPDEKNNKHVEECVIDTDTEQEVDDRATDEPRPRGRPVSAPLPGDTPVKDVKGDALGKILSKETTPERTKLAPGVLAVPRSFKRPKVSAWCSRSVPDLESQRESVNARYLELNNEALAVMQREDEYKRTIISVKTALDTEVRALLEKLEPYMQGDAQGFQAILDKIVEFATSKGADLAERLLNSNERAAAQELLQQLEAAVEETERELVKIESALNLARKAAAMSAAGSSQAMHSMDDSMHVKPNMSRLQQQQPVTGSEMVHESSTRQRDGFLGKIRTALWPTRSSG